MVPGDRASTATPSPTRDGVLPAVPAARAHRRRARRRGRRRSRRATCWRASPSRWPRSPARSTSLHRLVALELGEEAARRRPAGGAVPDVVLRSPPSTASRSSSHCPSARSTRRGWDRWALGGGRRRCWRAATRSAGSCCSSRWRSCGCRARRADGATRRGSPSCRLGLAGVSACTWRRRRATRRRRSARRTRGTASSPGRSGGAWDGAVAAWEGARQLVSGSREHVYFAAAAGDPFVVAATTSRLSRSCCFAVVRCRRCVSAPAARLRRVGAAGRGRAAALLPRRAAAADVAAALPRRRCSRCTSGWRAWATRPRAGAAGGPGQRGRWLAALTRAVRDVALGRVSVRAVLLDALGTLVELERPGARAARASWPRARRGRSTRRRPSAALAPRSPTTARTTTRARDRAAARRTCARRCAEVLRDALPPRAREARLEDRARGALLAALRFRAVPRGPAGARARCARPGPARRRVATGTSRCTRCSRDDRARGARRRR